MHNNRFKKDCFKLNTNGFVRGNPGVALAGRLIRDHKRTWVGSFNRAIGYTHSMAVELWGLRDGLTLARNLDIKKLLLEIDVQAIVDVINSQIADSTHPYNGLISDCRSFLWHFEEARLYHIHHEGNYWVDILAKEGMHNPSSLVFHSNLPPYILY